MSAVKKIEFPEFQKILRVPEKKELYGFVQSYHKSYGSFSFLVTQKQLYEKNVDVDLQFHVTFFCQVTSNQFLGKIVT